MDVANCVSDLVLACVYRARNQVVVERLAQDVIAAGGSVRLWALDGLAPRLEPWTLGTGPGGRFDLINVLLDGVGPEAAIVVTDDDVRMTRGSIADLLAKSVSAGLHLAQPAHSWGSSSTYRFCRRRPWLLARRTNFIEIGPMFVVTPDGRDTFTPFPGNTGMGWGVDLLWRDQAEAGVPIGIIDDVAIKHLTPLGQSYAMEEEGLKLRGMLDDRGLRDVESAQATVGRWWRHRDRAPWVNPDR